MRALDLISWELKSAAKSGHKVLRIRVTEVAIPGTIVALPLCHDRLVEVVRRFALIYGGEDTASIPGEAVNWRELLMHPSDWEEVGIELGSAHPSTVCNLPVEVG